MPTQRTFFPTLHHKPLTISQLGAFTLIELLVVMSIIGILAGIGLAQYRQFAARQILSQAAKKLKTDLRTIQQKALAEEKIPACGGLGGVKLDGWFLEVNQATDTYTYYGSCGVTRFDQHTEDLRAKGIEIAASSTPLRFFPLSKGTNQQFTYTLQNGSATATITVTPQGEIK